MKKTAINSILKEIGCKKIKLNQGGNGVSGYFTFKEQIFFIVKTNDSLNFIIKKTNKYGEMGKGQMYAAKYFTSRNESKKSINKTLEDILK